MTYDNHVAWAPTHTAARHQNKDNGNQKSERIYRDGEEPPRSKEAQDMFPNEHNPGRYSKSDERKRLPRGFREAGKDIEGKAYFHYICSTRSNSAPTYHALTKLGNRI